MGVVRVDWLQGPTLKCCVCTLGSSQSQLLPCCLSHSYSLLTLVSLMSPGSIKSFFLSLKRENRQDFHVGWGSINLGNKEIKVEETFFW